MQQQAALQVLDLLFDIGVQALFRMALSVYKVNSERLLQARSADAIITILKDTVYEEEACETLIKTALQFTKFPTSKVKQLRSKHKLVVIQVLLWCTYVELHTLS